MEVGVFLPELLNIVQRLSVCHAQNLTVFRRMPFCDAASKFQEERSSVLDTLKTIGGDNDTVEG